MRQWAFARVSLKLSDAEFFGYTHPQLDALTDAWAENRQWELAVQTACALNAKWSSSKTILPFSPRDFLPKSKEEERAEAEVKERALELRFAAMASSLTKKGTADGARK